MSHEPCRCGQGEMVKVLESENVLLYSPDDPLSPLSIYIRIPVLRCSCEYCKHTEEYPKPIQLNLIYRAIRKAKALGFIPGC